MSVSSYWTRIKNVHERFNIDGTVRAFVPHLPKAVWTEIGDCISAREHAPLATAPGSMCIVLRLDIRKWSTLGPKILGKGDDETYSWPESKIMPGQSFWIGSAPFCDPDPSQCQITPGYQPVATSKSGDGHRCWFGKKIKCQFNQDAWRQTSTFSQLKMELGDAAEGVVPQFAWLGVAPACAASPCDCFEAGLMPIFEDKEGDGSECSSGNKWLCVMPMLKDQKDLTATGMSQCFQQDAAREATIQKALDLGDELVKDISAAIQKFGGTKSAEYYRQAASGSSSGSQSAIIAVVIIALLIALGIVIHEMSKR
jgi:hypothetical protein